jgi:hypothetical protein
MEEENMTDIPEAMRPLVEAAGDQVEAVLKTVETRVNSPGERTAEAAVQLSTGTQLKEALGKYFSESGKIAWGNVKALGVGALSLIPVLGGAGEVGVAMTESATLEGATQAEASALAKGAVVSEAGKVVNPLTKVLGEKGAKRVGKVLKALDPFPDVPTGLVVASGGAEALGLEGAGAIPAGIQLMINEFKKRKLQFGTAKEIGTILIHSLEAGKVKEFAASTVDIIRERLANASAPRMAAAAQAFA